MVIDNIVKIFFYLIVQSKFYQKLKKNFKMVFLKYKVKYKFKQFVIIDKIIVQLMSI